MNSLTFLAVSCVTCHRSAVVIAFWLDSWCDHGATCHFTTGERNMCKDGCIANRRGECIAEVVRQRRLEEFLAA